MCNMFYCSCVRKANTSIVPKHCRCHRVKVFRKDSIHSCFEKIKLIPTIWIIRFWLCHEKCICKYVFVVGRETVQTDTAYAYYLLQYYWDIVTNLSIFKTNNDYLWVTIRKNLPSMQRMEWIQCTRYPSHVSWMHRTLEENSFILSLSPSIANIYSFFF